MLIGKIKISSFRNFMEKNANFEKKIKAKILSYKDYNMRMIFSMIKNAALFG